jgi:hypothetical protein
VLRESKLPLEYFLNIYCDRCGSNLQSNSYQGVIDIVREHLNQTNSICKVENTKISLRTDKRDPASLSYNCRLNIIESIGPIDII